VLHWQQELHDAFAAGELERDFVAIDPEISIGIGRDLFARLRTRASCAETDASLLQAES